MKLTVLAFLLISFVSNAHTNDIDNNLNPGFENEPLTLNNNFNKAKNENTSIYDHSFNMANYFSNLKKYSPANIGTSCGYVSLTQLLSYIDTFINDDFVPEKYEKFNLYSQTFEEAIEESPGVLKNKNYSKLNVYSFVNKYYETDYQSFLIKTMNELENRKSAVWHDKISVDGYEKLLKAILPNFQVGYEKYRTSDEADKRIFLTKEKQQEYSNIIKNQITLGNPVVVHVAKGLNSDNSYIEYHSVIAYDYDVNNIYAHFGWNEGTERLPLTYDGYYITDYGYFSMEDIPHKDSNNYVVKNYGFCGCNQHNHLFYPVWVDYKYHLLSCYCGSTKKMPHIISSSSLKALPIRKTCSICKGEVETGLIIGPNKSHVQQNGIVVLMDSDLELYKIGLFDLKELSIL